MSLGTPRRSFVSTALISLTALLASVGLDVQQARARNKGQPTRRSSRGPSRYTHPGTPGPQRNLYGIPWKRLTSASAAERFAAWNLLDSLERAGGSQAVHAARRALRRVG